MSEQSRSGFVIAVLVALLGGLVAIATPHERAGGKVFRGIWHDGFEKAAFFQGHSAENLPNLYETSDGWLSFEEGAWPTEVRSPDDPDWDSNAVFEIEFLGHRVDGPTGHLGKYPAEYVAERVIRIERLSLEDAIGASKPLEGTQP